MSGLAERFVALSPEKRKALLRQLQQKQVQAGLLVLVQQQTQAE